MKVGGALFTYFILFGLAVLLFLAIAADVLVQIAPPAYADASPLIPLMAAGFLVHGVLVATNRSAAIPRKRSRYVLAAILSLVSFGSARAAADPAAGGVRGSPFGDRRLLRGGSISDLARPARTEPDGAFRPTTHGRSARHGWLYNRRAAFARSRRLADGDRARRAGRICPVASACSRGAAGPHSRACWNRTWGDELAEDSARSTGVASSAGRARTTEAAPGHSHGR